MSARDKAFAAVTARLSRAAAGEDAAVLGPDALAEATRLAEAVEDAAPARARIAAQVPVDVAAVHALGDLHWRRHQLHPQDGDDERAAHLWFGRLLPWQPALVPPQLYAVLAGQAPLSGPTPVHWNAEAARLLTSPAAGTLEILDRAIRLLSSTYAAVQQPFMGGTLLNLGSAWHSRYALTGELANLDRAIEATRQGLALSALPGGLGGQAHYLSNLSRFLRDRATATRSSMDADEAVALARAAVASAEANDQLSILRLMLAEALRSRFDLVGAPADLDEALAIEPPAS